MNKTSTLVIATAVIAAAGLLPHSILVAATKATPADVASLITTLGKVPMSQADVGRIRGKDLIVVFGFTSCADICPLTLLAVREAMRRLDARNVAATPVFVSVDPDRDEPGKLRAYASAFDKRIIGTTGPNDRLTRLTSALGIFYEKRWTNAPAGAYVLDHSAVISIVPGDGKAVITVSSAGGTQQVAERIVEAVLR